MPERDYRRRLIWRKEGKPPRRIVCAQHIRDRWSGLGLTGRKLQRYTAGGTGALEAKLLKHAERYEAAIESSYEECGLAEVEQAEADAYKAALDLAERTDAIPATTLDGIEIKARAAAVMALFGSRQIYAVGVARDLMTLNRSSAVPTT
jgi:hypothetical protein